MPLTEASQLSIIKADVKDNYYAKFLKDNLSDLYLRILGPQSWVVWKREIGLLSQLLYYFLTTVQGSQTLGEEYACLIQVNSAKTQIPSLLQRITFVTLKCISPFAIERLSLNMQSRVLTLNGVPDNDKKYLSALISFLKKCIPIITNIHLMAFYMDGSYASIAKRIVGIRYVSARQRSLAERNTTFFNWLTFLFGVQVSFETYKLFNEFKMELAEDKENSNRFLDRSAQVKRVKCSSQIKCILCLEMIRDLSATRCGHIFCWKCIIEWCSAKAECPTCRQRCHPSNVIFLHHFVG